MSEPSSDKTVARLLRQQAGLAALGTLAVRETDLVNLVSEAAAVCAACLEVPFCTIFRYRAAENDLVIEAGVGWQVDVVGLVALQVNESSPQGRAFVTGSPVIVRNLPEINNLALPSIYSESGIVSLIDVAIVACNGERYGVLEIESPIPLPSDREDVNFLISFSNVLGEAVAAATKNRAMRALLEERSLLAKELPRRIRGDLKGISGMLEVCSRAVADSTSRNAIDAITRHVVTLAQVYDALLIVKLSRSVDVGGFLQELCTAPSANGKESGGEAEEPQSVDARIMIRYEQ